VDETSFAVTAIDHHNGVEISAV